MKSKNQKHMKEIEVKEKVHASNEKKKENQPIYRASALVNKDRGGP